MSVWKQMEQVTSSILVEYFQGGEPRRLALVQSGSSDPQTMVTSLYTDSEAFAVTQINYLPDVYLPFF